MIRPGDIIDDGRLPDDPLKDIGKEWNDPPPKKPNGADATKRKKAKRRFERSSRPAD